MTIARAAILPLSALLALGACDREPTPDAASPDDVTEAATMADDAVGLAEAALDNAAMTDVPPATGSTAPAGRAATPAEPAPTMEEDAGSEDEDAAAE